MQLTVYDLKGEKERRAFSILNRAINLDCEQPLRKAILDDAHKVLQKVRNRKEKRREEYMNFLARRPIRKAQKGKRSQRITINVR
jgi:hypothetical protein